jgi:molybdopterin-guanine dinucleotide biosynthesis protein A
LQILSENRKLTGIVLSGGKSSRMGKDKGFCELNKKPLIAYSIDVLSSVCSQIIIGANTNDYNYLGYPVIHDKIKDIGPIGGIYSCLKSSKTSDNIILSCDMPLIPVALIEYILSKKADYDIVIPISNSFPEPLCAYYNKSITPNLFESISAKKYKIQDVVKGFKTNFLQIDSGLSFYHDNLFANINSQQDLMEIENHLSK